MITGTKRGNRRPQTTSTNPVLGQFQPVLSLQMLQARYPLSRIVLPPLLGCPMCDGTGEFTDVINRLSACSCMALNRVHHTNQVRMNLMKTEKERDVRIKEANRLFEEQKAREAKKKKL